MSAVGRRAPRRAGIAVRTAITRTVPGTTASSCQSGGAIVSALLTAGKSAMPPGMPRAAPASAGSTCAAESPALTCCGVAPSARANADECLASSAVAQVMKIALTAASATSVIVISSSTWSRRSARKLPSAEPVPGWSTLSTAWAVSAATTPLTEIAMLSTPRTGPRGRAQPEQQRDRQPCRERDQPGGAPGCAGGVSQRADGARARGTNGGDEGRGDRDRERDGRHHADGGQGQRRRSRPAEHARAGVDQQRSAQPSEPQSGRRREQGDDHVLG